MIDQIKNIRFTNQSPERIYPWLRRIRVGISGGSEGRFGANSRPNELDGDRVMSTQIPVVPVAGSAVLRAFLALLALVTRWAKAITRAHRHRREAAVLAGLDRRMLADIGINRSDLRDAFSEPFWEDPTALLSERVAERRQNRSAAHVMTNRAESGFKASQPHNVPRFMI
jgi:uncharacterized protein YjiS (DUF1127 family)